MKKTCHTRGFTAALTVSAHLRPGIRRHQVKCARVLHDISILQLTVVELNASISTNNINLCVFAKIA